MQSNNLAMPPKFVNIETSTACNQRCYFCPVSVTKRPKQRLSMSQLETIVTQLKQYPVHAIDLRGFYEPTYDKQLLEKATFIRQAGFPITLFTNGSGLTPRITLNLSSLDAAEYKSTRGRPDLSKVIAHFDYLLQQVAARAITIDLNLLILGRLDMRHANNAQAISARFSSATGLKIWFSPVADFAGEPFQQFTSTEAQPSQQLRGCARNYPTDWLYFSANGQLLLCCHDYHEQYAAGTIDQQSVAELYNSAQFKQWRRWSSGEEIAPTDFICRRCVFVLTAEVDYVSRLQQLFCQQCQLPRVLGEVQSCGRCEVNVTIQAYQAGNGCAATAG